MVDGEAWKAELDCTLTLPGAVRADALRRRRGVHARRTAGARPAARRRGARAMASGGRRGSPIDRTRSGSTATSSPCTSARCRSSRGPTHRSLRRSHTSTSSSSRTSRARWSASASRSARRDRDERVSPALRQRRPTRRAATCSATPCSKGVVRVDEATDLHVELPPAVDAPASGTLIDQHEYPVWRRTPSYDLRRERLGRRDPGCGRGYSHAVPYPEAAAPDLRAADDRLDGRGGGGRRRRQGRGRRGPGPRARAGARRPCRVRGPGAAARDRRRGQGGRGPDRAARRP